MEPIFAVQFFFDDLLAHVQELLCDEAFEFPEGLFFKDRAYLFMFLGYALM